MMSEQEMNTMNYGDESDHDLISKEMSKDIRDGSQTHLNIISREACYKCVIVLGKENWKGREH